MVKRCSCGRLGSCGPCCGNPWGQHHRGPPTPLGCRRESSEDRPILGAADAGSRARWEPRLGREGARAASPALLLAPQRLPKPVQGPRGEGRVRQSEFGPSEPEPGGGSRVSRRGTMCGPLESSGPWRGSPAPSKAQGCRTQEAPGGAVSSALQKALPQDAGPGKKALSVESHGSVRGEGGVPGCGSAGTGAPTWFWGCPSAMGQR